jgi:hypothetical protein
MAFPFALFIMQIRYVSVLHQRTTRASRLIAYDLAMLRDAGCKIKSYERNAESVIMIFALVALQILRIANLHFLEMLIVQSSVFSISHTLLQDV